MLVVDCSYTDLPVFGGRDATQEFLEGPRLQGALRFDVDVCCAPSCALPHMEPSPGFVDEYVRRLLRRQEEADGGDLRGEAGSEDLSALKRSVLVVAYDSVGFFSAPRVWWLLSRAGWEVRVLNGGLKAAVACGAELDWTPLSSDCLVSMPERDAFASAQGLASNRRRREGLATYEEVLLAVCQAQRSGAKACEESLPFVLVDARPAARFLGQEPEPREGLFSGRIPCAMNLPFARVWSERCVWGGTEKDAAAALLPQQSLPPSSSLSVFDSAAPLHPPFAWAELKEQRELKEALGPVLRRARVLGASLQQLQSDEGATAPLDFSNAKPVVATCGSGLTACVLYCALLEVSPRDSFARRVPTPQPCDRGRQVYVQTDGVCGGSELGLRRSASLRRFSKYSTAPGRNGCKEDKRRAFKTRANPGW